MIWRGPDLVTNQSHAVFFELPNRSESVTNALSLANLLAIDSAWPCGFCLHNINVVRSLSSARSLSTQYSRCILHKPCLVYRSTAEADQTMSVSESGLRGSEGMTSCRLPFIAFYMADRGHGRRDHLWSQTGSLIVDQTGAGGEMRPNPPTHHISRRGRPTADRLMGQVDDPRVGLQRKVALGERWRKHFGQALRKAT